MWVQKTASAIYAEMGLIAREREVMKSRPSKHNYKLTVTGLDHWMRRPLYSAFTCRSCNIHSPDNRPEAARLSDVSDTIPQKVENKT